MLRVFRVLGFRIELGAGAPFEGSFKASVRGFRALCIINIKPSTPNHAGLRDSLFAGLFGTPPPARVHRL